MSKARNIRRKLQRQEASHIHRDVQAFRADGDKMWNRFVDMFNHMPLPKRAWMAVKLIFKRLHAVQRPETDGGVRPAGA